MEKCKKKPSDNDNTSCSTQFHKKDTHRKNCIPSSPLFLLSRSLLSLFFDSGSTNKKSKYELITKDELHFALATLLDTSDA